MRPGNDLLEGTLPLGATARVLVKSGQDYVLYVRTPAPNEPGGQCLHQSFTNQQLTLTLALPAGRFKAEWFDTSHGSAARRESFSHPGGMRKFIAPAFADDIALAVRKVADLDSACTAY